MAGRKTSPGDSPTESKDREMARADEWDRARKERKREDVIKERYGVWEFLVPLTLLTLFLLATIAWAFWPGGTYAFGGHFATTENTLHTYFWDTIATMPAALVAMLTAYLFVAYGLARCYHRSDITPGHIGMRSNGCLWSF